MFHSIKTRIVAAFLLIIVLTIAIASIVVFQVSEVQERDIMDTKGHEAATTCALTLRIAIEDFDSFKPGTEDYETCRTVLRSLCQNEGMSYMYAYMLDPIDNTMTYVIVAAASDEADDYIVENRPYGTVVETEVDPVELIALQGSSSETPIEYDNQFGHMLDWVMLVDEDRHLLAGASYAVSEQRKAVIASAVSLVAPFVAVLFALMIIQLLILQRGVMKPLNVISKRMMEFRAEDARSFEPIGIETADELGKISKAFNGMVVEIGSYLEDIETMTAAKVQTDVEFDVARKIQLGMVPTTRRVSSSFADVFAFSRPAREIGGDFYDVVEMADGSLAIVIGDVSGKGVAAALFMAMSKEMVRIELSNGKSPADALMSSNERICANNPEGMFVTAMIAVIDANGAVTFANAGHLPPVRISEKASAVECSAGCLLGLFDDVEIVNESIELAPGEALLLYTDGASEAVNAKREFLGDAAIREALSERAPYMDARDVLDGLVGIVDGFAAQVEQFDDLTAIALMRRGDDEVCAKTGDPDVDGEPALTALEVSIASFSEIRRDVMDGCERPARLRACLACEEVFVNIVSYSEASHIYYGVLEVEGRLVVILKDDGVPFDPLMAQPIEREFEELDSGGMGIALVKDIAEELSYKRSGGHNIMTMTFDLGGPSRMEP